jgi:hypothetical protein
MNTQYGNYSSFDNSPMSSMGGQMPGMGLSSIPGPSVSPMDSSIANMRWENDELRNELIILLGNYEKRVEKDGTVRFYRNHTTRPIMNDEGVMNVVALIRGAVNSVTSLSNIDETDSNELTFQVLVAAAKNISLGQQRYGMRVEDMDLAMSIIKMIVFAQLKRAVGGHESKNFTTQHVVQNIEQQSRHQEGSGGWHFWPSRRGG